MSYESAPATKMLATDCAICGRPLLDAKSVECGIGPVCREESGYSPEAVGAEAWARANKIIHTIALHPKSDEVPGLCNELVDLGFTGVARAVGKRLCRVRIEIEGTKLTVKTDEFSAAWVALGRTVRGRQWDRGRKVTCFPVQERVAVYQALIQAFPGQPAMGPRGFFTIGQQRA